MAGLLDVLDDWVGRSQAAKAPIINRYPVPLREPTVNIIRGGATTPQYPPLPPQPFPTPDDVAMARDYKTRFGNANEQMIQSGLLANQIPDSEAPQFDQREAAGTPQRGQQTPINQPTADTLYAAQIAAQRSPLGYLGYDVNRMVVTPPHQGDTALDYAGVYYPKTDRVWSDLNFPTNPVHESIHRGIQELRKQGLSIDHDLEETLVRAEMQKRFGNVEQTNRDQIEQGRQMLTDPKYKALMADIENKANAEIARRNLAKGPL